MTDKAFLEFVKNTMKNLVRNLLSALTNEERLEVLGILTDKFCMHCGGTEGTKCHCMNDD